MEVCEECKSKGKLYDAILDGKIKRLCERCIMINRAIKIEKPKIIALPEEKRLSVRERLSEMAGIKENESSKPIKLDFKIESTKHIKIRDLIELKKKMEEEQEKEKPNEK